MFKLYNFEPAVEFVATQCGSYDLSNVNIALFIVIKICVNYIILNWK